MFKSLQSRINLMFVILAMLLGSLLFFYWINDLEPRLKAEKIASASMVAHAQSEIIETAILAVDGEIKPEAITEAMDQILPLTDSSTDTPFIDGVMLQVDPSVIKIAAGQSEFVRGHTACTDCFTTEIPIYLRPSNELAAIAKFHGSTIFFERLKSDIMLKMITGAFLICILLLVTWLIVARLINPLSLLSASISDNTGEKLFLLPKLHGAVSSEILLLREALNMLLTRIRRDTASLSESEEQIRLLLNSTSEAICSIDLDGNCTMVNATCLRILGYHNEQKIIGKKMHQLIHHTTNAGEEYPQKNCPIRQALQIEEGCHIDNELFWRADGTSFPVEYWSFPIQKDGKCIGAVVTFMDISARKKAEKALRSAEKKFRQLRDSLSDGYASANIEGTLIECNSAFSRMLGYSKDEISSLTFQELTPTKWHAMEAKMIDEKILAHGYSDVYEKEYIRKDGTVFPVELRAFLASAEQDNPAHLWAIVTDISTRKEAEKKLKESLNEKEVLLKEIHHRVKNNMQIISSLLYLQSENTKSAEVKSLLNDSRNRVRSMALIHEKLYRSDDLAMIDFGDYVQVLTQQIIQSYHDVAKRVHLHTQADDIFLPVDAAIPCGLIINELITNCLKHAFPKDHKDGEIHIVIKEHNSSSISIVIRDNGIGLPTGAGSVDTLGIRLINNLASQLDASCQSHSDNGTIWEIKFKIKEEGES